VCAPRALRKPLLLRPLRPLRRCRCCCCCCCCCCVPLLYTLDEDRSRSMYDEAWARSRRIWARSERRHVTLGNALTRAREGGREGGGRGKDECEIRGGRSFVLPAVKLVDNIPESLSSVGRTLLRGRPKMRARAALSSIIPRERARARERASPNARKGGRIINQVSDDNAHH